MTGAWTDAGAWARAGRMTDESADFAVIGSGAAGGTVARVLAARGFSVVVLEEGPAPDRARAARGLVSAMTHLFRGQGLTAMTGRSVIPYLQGRCLGGSTVINSAICWRLPEDAWARCWADSGLAAAVPLEALETAYAALEAELAVRPVPETRLNGNDRRMREACATLGWRGRAIHRNERDCTGSALCLQGCPGGRKQSVDVTFLPRAARAGARVYAGCEAVGLGREGGRVAWVEARGAGPDAPPQARLRVRTRRGVVLAASAIQTPCLLRRWGAGNPAHVGAHFRVHPGAAMVGEFDPPVRMWEGATQGWESDAFRRQGFKFETIALPFELGAVRLPGFGPALARTLGDWGRFACWAVQVRAEAEGSVRPGWWGPRVRFTPSEWDMRRMRRGLSILARMMFAAGARAVYPGVGGLPERLDSPDQAGLLRRGPLDPRAYKMIATHLFGTARMSLHPRDGVVGPDFQVHDTPGLYVADSSVFPNNLGVNPQHTIMATAWVAAERWAARTAPTLRS